MLRVGLTGGLASGKSLIGKELARLGCHVIDADALGHEVLMPSGEAYAAVIGEFAKDSIVEPDGTINRRALSKIVFEDPERLKALTAIVHPAVHRHPNPVGRLERTGGTRSLERLQPIPCQTKTRPEITAAPTRIYSTISPPNSA